MKKVMFAAAFAALVSAGQAGAQQFPARPVTMVIPFAAGGPQDTIGRVIAQRMSELLPAPESASTSVVMRVMMRPPSSRS